MGSDPEPLSGSFLDLRYSTGEELAPSSAGEMAKAVVLSESDSATTVLAPPISGDGHALVVGFPTIRQSLVSPGSPAVDAGFPGSVSGEFPVLDPDPEPVLDLVPVLEPDIGAVLVSTPPRVW
jgi:hypothetical protein